MSHAPLVSVIIPAYNYGCFILGTIDSVLGQDFDQSQIEIIVVDDGSTDDTAERVKKYGPRINYIYQDNLGKALATKRAIEAASGKYLFNLDADDMFLPQKIRNVVDIFETDREITHVGHPVLFWYTARNTKKKEVISAKLTGRKLNGKDLLLCFYRNNRFIGGGSTFSCRTADIKKALITKEMGLYVDEYLTMYALNNGYSYFIEESLSVYRIHGRNISNMYNKDKMGLRVSTHEAILKEIKSESFPEEVKVLYSLKTQVAGLLLKELFNEKKAGDVFRLWRYFFKNLRLFGRNFLRIAISYHLPQRTLPTFVFRMLRLR